MTPQCVPRWLTPDWPAPAGVRALSTLRGGGVSGSPYASLNLGDHVGDASAAVAENRRSLRAAAGLPAEPAWLEQVHGICVKDLDSRAVDPNRAGPAADAAITRHPGRVCAILTADCLPVLLAVDRGATHASHGWPGMATQGLRGAGTAQRNAAHSGAAVGAAHAGWRGLAAGVIEATVSALGAPPGDLLAWLGPAIGPRHFEIGAEVREALLRGDPGAEAAFEFNARGRFMADLHALARRRLARVGVKRVYGGGECTYADGDKYFSHRRDGQTGRQATLIWLEPLPRG